MGYDDPQQPSSSGALIALVGVVLIVAILGVLVVAGAGLFFVQTSRVQVQRAMVAKERAVAETHRAEAEALMAVEEAQADAMSDPRLNFEVTIDREGSVSIDGKAIGLDELRTQLAKLKIETSGAFSVRINADPECPVKHIIPVLDVCEAVGEIDYRIVASSDGTDVRMTATVASYEPAAEWDHFDDGTFSAYDSITLRVVAPERYASATFSVTVPPTELPEDSALRTAGTRLSFTVRESDIGAAGLAWGAIDDPTIVQ
jgi:biopolymer transport protein ExbD